MSRSGPPKAGFFCPVASVVVGKLSEKRDLTRGYDAQGGKYVDMLRAGIIDPTKVVRTALQDAASIGGLLVTTEAMIADPGHLLQSIRDPIGPRRRSTVRFHASPAPKLQRRQIIPYLEC